MKRLLASFTICGGLLSACTSSGISEERFLSMEEPLLISDGNTVLEYDANSCQTALNREKGEFRLMKDNLSDYFCVNLGSLALKAGEEVSGSVVWSEPEDIIEKDKVRFKVLKTNGSLAWILSDKDNLQIILRTE